MSSPTGRLSPSAPNMQNILIRTEEGRLIREAFISNIKGKPAMSLVPTFDVEFDTVIADSRRVERNQMTFLHMSHRFGPVTTARLLAGDTVERYNRTKVRIVGMTLQETDRRQEPAL